MLSSEVLERNLDMLVSEVHVASEGAVGLPVTGGARGALLQHLVDLLKRKTLSFRNKEVGEKDCLWISKRLHVAARKMENLHETQQSEPHRKKTFDPIRAESSRSATR